METNLYASPAEHLDSDYFASEPRWLTLRELLRSVPPKLGAMVQAVLVKTFWLPVPPVVGHAIKNPTRCQPGELTELLARFPKTLAALERLNFRPVYGMKVPTVGDCFSQNMALLGPDPTIYAVIEHAEVKTGDRIDVNVGLSFVSSDGNTVRVTTNLRETICLPPQFEMVYSSLKSPEELLAVHKDRLKLSPSVESVRFATDDAIWRAEFEHEQTIVDHLIERGVLRPMTKMEVETIQTRMNEQRTT